MLLGTRCKVHHWVESCPIRLYWFFTSRSQLVKPWLAIPCMVVQMNMWVANIRLVTIKYVWTWMMKNELKRVINLRNFWQFLPAFCLSFTASLGSEGTTGARCTECAIMSSRTNNCYLKHLGSDLGLLHMYAI